MLLRREGLPDDDELVLCTVTGVQPHCVFARLDEYDKTGLIHISEIAPGRIRNIREYVEEGKKVVCKVLRTDKEKGHIDLSLRRVNEKQKRLKLNAIKQELMSEKILEQLSFKNKVKVQDLYNKVTDIIFNKYPNLFDCFKDVAEGKVTLEALGIDKTLAKEITDVVKDRLVAEEISVKGDLHLRSTAADGVAQIREALTGAEDVDKAVNIRYLGNGTYHVSVTAEDYKTGEKILKSATDHVLDFAKKHKMTATFDRQES
jgi:translation initiation factor 2 subunit 1